MSDVELQRDGHTRGGVPAPAAGAPGPAGAGEILESSQATLEEAMVSIRLTAPSVSHTAPRSGPGDGALYVLPAGTIPPDPGEFVGSQRLAQIVGGLRARFDFVLIDAPPILAVGDAVSLSVLADALFVVVRLDVIDRPTLRDLSRALNSCPCLRLGFVLTNVEVKEFYGTAHYGQAARESGRQHTEVRGVAATPR